VLWYSVTYLLYMSSVTYLLYMSSVDLSTVYV